MSKNRIFSLAVFLSGLGLSLITNLFSGDSDIRSFYDEHRSIILLVGVALIVISIFSSIKEESSSGGGNATSGVKILGTAFVAGIWNLIIGVIIGLIVIWLFSFAGYEVEVPILSQKLLITNELKLRITSCVAAALVGYRFKYIYGDDFSGAVMGVAIGFSASFYFPQDISLPFLPEWLSKLPVISSGLISGAIGLFTGVFETTYKETKKRIEKENREWHTNQLEHYETAISLLKEQGFEVYANTLTGHLMAWGENLERQNILKNSDSDKITKKTVRDSMNEIKGSLDSQPQLVLFKAVLSGNSNKLPSPPYRVFNQNGEEVQKFSSVQALYEFSTRQKLQVQNSSLEQSIQLPRHKKEPRRENNVQESTTITENARKGGLQENTLEKNDDENKPIPPKQKVPTKTSKDELPYATFHPTGKIEEIKVDYNVSKKDAEGMVIHIRFTVQDLKGVECRAVAYFSFTSGEALKDLNEKYCTVNGNVSVSDDFTPEYDNTVFEDFQLFMPYDEFHITTKGVSNLKFMIKLYVESTQNFFASSDYRGFTYTIG